MVSVLKLPQESSSDEDGWSEWPMGKKLGFRVENKGNIWKHEMYPLVMTNSLPWKITPIFKNGKPSISMGHFPWLC